MRLAHKAFLLYAMAFGIEKRAAMSLLNKYDKEPTRSILFKSASWLAIQCEMYQEATELARHGLTGNPPIELRDELEKILKIANNGQK